MQNQFDPYRDWLEIASSRRPPTHYELLGLPAFSDSAAAAQTAARDRIAHVRKYQAGKHSDAAIRLMNEISQAMTCLTDPASKAEYDRQLRGFATVEEAAAEGLFPTVAELPREENKPLETLTAVVAAVDPPTGAATVTEATADSAVVDSASRRIPLWVLPTAVGAVSCLVMAYVVFRLITAGSDVAEVRPDSSVVSPAEAPAAEVVTVEPVTTPAVPSVTTTMPEQTPLAAPNATTAPAASSQPVASSSGAPPATPTPAVPANSLLSAGVSGKWEGKLAQIYVDTARLQAHLLLTIDQPAPAVIEAISNDYAAFLALFPLLSDAESGGQGDRLRIEGTPQQSAGGLFSQRTEPLVIQLTAMETVGSTTPGFRAGQAPTSMMPLKLKSPLSFLQRMRPQAGLTYTFTAEIRTVTKDQRGLTVSVVDGSQDLREVPVTFAPGEFQADAANTFRAGETVIVQAEAQNEPPPKLALRGVHLCKALSPTAELGSRRTSVVDVAQNMAMAHTLASRFGTPFGSSPLLPPQANTGRGFGFAGGEVPGQTMPAANPTGALSPPGGNAATTPNAGAANANATRPLFTLTESPTGSAVFNHLVWSSDGTRIATASTQCRVWNAATGAAETTIAESLNMNGELRFTADAQALSIVNLSREWKLYDLDSNAVLVSHPLMVDNAYRTSITPDGEVVVASAGSATGGVLLAASGPSWPVLVWDAEKNRQSDEIKNVQYVQSVSVSPDGRYLLVATAGNLMLYKRASGKWAGGRSVGRLAGIMALWWLPGGDHHFAALTGGYQLGVADAENPTRPPYFTATGVMLPLSWSYDGKQVAMLTRGQYIVQNLAGRGNNLANAADPLAAARMNPASGSCMAAVFSPVNQYLALGYSDGSIVLRDEKAGQEVAKFSSNSPLTSLVWSPQGDRLASVHYGYACIWDTAKYAESSDTAAPRRPAGRKP